MSALLLEISEVGYHHPEVASSSLAEGILFLLAFPQKWEYLNSAFTNIHISSQNEAVETELILRPCENRHCSILPGEGEAMMSIGFS